MFRLSYGHDVVMQKCLKKSRIQNIPHIICCHVSKYPTLKCLRPTYPYQLSFKKLLVFDVTLYSPLYSYYLSYTYSMGQVINSVCVCQSVSVSCSVCAFL